MKLDLACGTSVQPGFQGIDSRPLPDVWVANLFDAPWLIATPLTPVATELGTSTIDEIFCSHFVEHVPDLIGFMNEVWRVCKPGALVTIVHPYQHSNRAWQDPTHVRALNEDSWPYYDAEWRQKTTLEYGAFDCDFVCENVEYVLAETLRSLPMTPELEAMCRHGVNVVDDLVVTLRVRKG